MPTSLEIDGLAPGGEGFGRLGARPVFVPFTAPGDLVELDVPEGDEAAHVAAFRVVRLGPDRVQPPCRHFGPGGGERECGGCEWLHLAYARQLAAKERAFSETLRRIGRLDPAAIGLGPIVPSPRPLRYRCRAKFHFDRASAKLVFFRRRSHLPVRLEECQLLVEGLDALRSAVGPALATVRLSPREVALEWSEREGRGAALLVLPELTPGARERAEALLAAVPALAGLVLQAEGAPSDTVGDPVLTHDRFPGAPERGIQRSRPDVFQQANRFSNALLVDEAIRLLAPDGEEVLELFCGAGNFTGPLLERAAHVAAVEAQGPALELARRDLTGPKGRFFAGKALDLARAFARERGEGARHFTRVLLDPPRDGAKGIGSALRDLGVERAVYVSCDPATFARDLKECVGVGLRIAAVQPFDHFPQTHHVEGVALLVR
ncbi:MAG: class I SAM-dependent RNA methyltransferase [Anaeromyxobacteraceae bacterium]